MITKEQMNTVFDLLMARHLKVVDNYANGVWNVNGHGFPTVTRRERLELFHASCTAIDIYQSAKRKMLG
jgi:hypothetical protein